MYKTAICILLVGATAKGQEQHSGLLARDFPVHSLSATSLGTSSVRKQESRWYGRVGVVGTIYHSSATFKTGGVKIPDASAQVSDNRTLSFDVGYHITRNISAQMMLGIPPRPTITGQGTVAHLGTLGAVRYGPGMLTGLYRVRRLGALQPYAGPGIVYAIFLKDHDGSVSDLHVANNFGAVLQAGAEYKLAGRWSVFGDFKEVWLGVNAHGLIGGAIPVTAHVPLNPSLVSAGVTFRVGRMRSESRFSPASGINP